MTKRTPNPDVTIDKLAALRADVDALATEVARLSALVEGYMGLYRKLEAIVERYLAPQAELLAPHPRETEEQRLRRLNDETTRSTKLTQADLGVRCNAREVEQAEPQDDAEQAPARSLQFGDPVWYEDENGDRHAGWVTKAPWSWSGVSLLVTVRCLSRREGAGPICVPVSQVWPRDTSELQRLQVGDPVWLLNDDGEHEPRVVRLAPWQLGHGEWVASVDGRTGGWLLSRMLPREDSARCVSDACFVCGEPIGESPCAVGIVSTLSRKQRLHWPECAAMYIKQQVSGDVEAARLDELRTLRKGDSVWCREFDGSESPRVVDGEPRCMPSGLWAVPLDGDDGLVTLLRRLRRRDPERCEDEETPHGDE